MDNSAPERRPGLAGYIALRYVGAGRGGGLVSFMSAIAILGLALSIALLLTVLSILNGFDREMRQSVLGIVPHIALRSSGGVSAAEWSVLQADLAATADIASISPLIESPAVIVASGIGRGVIVNGVDAATEAEVSALDRFMLWGGLNALAEDRWGIVLGETLARELDVGPGDQVQLYSPSLSINPLMSAVNFRNFEISGVFRVGSRELDGRLTWVNRAAARALFRPDGPQNAIWARSDDVLAADRLLQEIAPRMPPEVELRSWSADFGGVYQNIRFSRALISLLLWLLIAVAAFNLVVSLIMIVRDKRADIAILRTLGAEPGVIRRIFLFQGALIGLIGACLGLAAGTLGSLYIGDLAALIETQFDFELLNAEVYPMDYLPSDLRPIDICVIGGGVMLLSMLATIYPAHRAAAVRPAVALRAE